MPPTQALTPPDKVPQQRLRRFVRQPDKFENRQLTRKTFEILAIIERYRFLSSSLLTHLATGDRRNTYQHLQTLFHKGLANRFALPTLYGTPGEYIYYLDSLASFHLLIEHGLVDQEDEADRKRREEVIRLNREKAYSQLHKDPDQQGKLLYIQHELMVSRFHAMLELACRKLAGKVLLEQWKQGPQLYGRVELPKVTPHHRDETTGRTIWEEHARLEFLPHRPDAFFTLYFPTKPEGEQRSNFMYEADRGTENTSRYKLKLRSHWHFIVKKNLQRQAPYNVHSIRAVLTETTSLRWANNLRQAAAENIVSPNPSPLLWFTSLEKLTKPAAPGQAPLYLQEPEWVFKKIWQSAASDTPLDLSQ